MIRAALLAVPLLSVGYAPSTQSPVVVPAQILGNYFAVEGAINGQNAKFIVDSGAGLSVLTPAAAKKFGVKDGQKIMATGAGEKAVPAMLSTVGKFSVGKGEAANVQIVVLDLPPVLGVDGLVGYSFLKNFAVQFDYQKPSMTLFNHSAYNPGSKAKTSEMKIRNNIPTCKGSLNGIEGWFTLDTGANGSLSVMGHFIETNKLKDKYPKRVSRIVGKGVGGYVHGDAVQLQEFNLGGFSLASMPGAFTAAKAGAFAATDIIGNVGGEVLRRFITTIDYGAGKIHFEKSSVFDDPFEVDRSGMFVDYVEGEAKVVEVVPGSAAAEAGLMVGDIIQSVNGRSLSQMHPLQAGKQFRLPAGTKIQMRLSRGGSQIDAAMILKDLL